MKKFVVLWWAGLLFCAGCSEESVVYESAEENVGQRPVYVGTPARHYTFPTNPQYARRNTRRACCRGRHIG